MQDRLTEILVSDLEPIKKYRALSRLAEDAEDAGDYEFGKNVRAERIKITSPRTGEPYPNHGSRFPHNYFHARQPQVIVVKEKHGTNYYDASTPEKAALACLDVIKQRLDPEFCWYMDELPADTDSEEEVISIIAMAKENLTPKKVETPLTDKEQAERIVAMVEENLIKAGKAAAVFLEDRRDYEYEGIEFEMCVLHSEITKEND